MASEERSGAAASGAPTEQQSEANGAAVAPMPDSYLQEIRDLVERISCMQSVRVPELLRAAACLGDLLVEYDEAKERQCKARDEVKALQARLSSLEEERRRLADLGREAYNAIGEAILCEDGLDGREGEDVMDRLGDAVEAAGYARCSACRWMFAPSDLYPALISDEEYGEVRGAACQLCIDTGELVVGDEPVTVRPLPEKPAVSEPNAGAALSRGDTTDG